MVCDSLQGQNFEGNTLVTKWRARIGIDKMAYMASKANWSDTETGAYQAAIPALGIAVTQSYPMPAG